MWFPLQCSDYFNPQAFKFFLYLKYVTAGAGDVAQVVARSPGVRVARVRTSAPHTNKSVVSADKKKKNKY